MDAGLLHLPRGKTGGGEVIPLGQVTAPVQSVGLDGAVYTPHGGGEEEGPCPVKVKPRVWVAARPSLVDYSGGGKDCLLSYAVDRGHACRRYSPARTVSGGDADREHRLTHRLKPLAARCRSTEGGDNNDTRTVSPPP